MSADLLSADLRPWPEGVARHILGAIDSTMMEAARLAPSLTGPAWILAARQTAGRGRRGRAWASPEGNLSASYLTRPACKPADVALYSFVAALALYEALRDLAGPQARLAIKWPNDVLLNGGKVAGILLESVSTAGTISHLAVGIGVNLAHVPPVEALEPRAIGPVSLQEALGQSVTPQAFLTPLAYHFAQFEAQLATYGFAPIRQAWLARAAKLGETITARLAQSEHSGRFESITESGALLLHTAEGPMTIAAADIFF